MCNNTSQSETLKMEQRQQQRILLQTIITSLEHVKCLALIYTYTTYKDQVWWTLTAPSPHIQNIYEIHVRIYVKSAIRVYLPAKIHASVHVQACEYYIFARVSILLHICPVVRTAVVITEVAKNDLIDVM